MRVEIIKFITLFSLISVCLLEGKIAQEYVHVDKAYKDGFEILELRDNKPVSIKYSNYNPKFNYIIKSNKVKEIEKILNNRAKDRYFVTLKVDTLGVNKQRVCLAYHYSKSRYKYCYLVSKKSVTPLYSEYHNLSMHKKRYYYLKLVK